MVSCLLHGALVVALVAAQQLPQPALDTAPEPLRLTVRLLPPEPPRPAARLLAAPPPATLADAARKADRPAVRPAVRPTAESAGLPADLPNDVLADSPIDVPVDSSAALPAAPPASAADLMAAAQRDAATFARELNREADKADGPRVRNDPRAQRAFHNTRQALLDRQFDEAWKAAHRWNGALPIKEVTRASDGNTRVYVLSTPLGKVCMFTRLEDHPPPGQNPGERTSYALCNR